MQLVMIRPDRLGSDGRRVGPPLSVDWGRGIGEEGERLQLGGDEGGCYSWDTKWINCN